MYPSKEKAEENSSSDAGLQKLDMKVWAFSSLLVFIRCFFMHFDGGGGQGNISLMILSVVVPRRLL